MNPSKEWASKELSVIIVSWNVREFLEPCLESVFVTSNDISIEVIVVDNGSSDGTAEWLEKEYPSVRLVKNLQNLGFPISNNIGISEAQGEYILLLNPDTIVWPGTFSNCLSVMRRDKKIGVVGCKIHYPDGSIQYECARNFPSLVDFIGGTFYLHVLFPKSVVFGRRLMGFWDHLSDRDVPCIMGAFMFLRRTALQETGPLDERFFMYYEDVDVCARMWEKGWRVFYLSSAQITHFSGQSRKKSSKKFDLLAAEISYTFFLEHRGRLAAISYRFIVILQALIRLLLVPLWLLAFGFLIPKSSCKSSSALNVQLHLAQILWGLGFRSYRDQVSPEQ